MQATSPEGAVGGTAQTSGIEYSDSNSFDAHSTDESSCKVEKLENELRIAKELIQSEFPIFYCVNFCFFLLILFPYI